MINRRNAMFQITVGTTALMIGVADAAEAAFATHPKIAPGGPRHARIHPRVRRRVSDHPVRHKAHQKFESHKGHNHPDFDHHRRHPHARAEHMRAYGTLDTPGNRRAMALTMWGEARGYGILGMRCIGHVIMNRVKLEQKRFGKGIHGVCYKRKQFSCHNPGDPNHQAMLKLPLMNPSNPDWLAFVEADKLAGKIIAGLDPDNTVGATFYFAEWCKPYWIDDMTIVGVMFGHIFCKEKKRVQRRRKIKKARHTRRGYCRRHHMRHKSLRRTRYKHKKG